MPIYEYVCMECECHFEELVRGDETPCCPDCGAGRVSRQLSVFVAHGSAATQPVPSSASGRRFGGCCGGSCGCH